MQESVFHTNLLSKPSINHSHTKHERTLVMNKCFTSLCALGVITLFNLLSPPSIAQTASQTAMDNIVIHDSCPKDNWDRVSPVCTARLTAYFAQLRTESRNTENAGTLPMPDYTIVNSMYNSPFYGTGEECNRAAHQDLPPGNTAICIPTHKPK